MTERYFNPEMLRIARDRLSFTQDELAREAGVTQALVSKLEHGFITQPSAEVLERLAGPLRCAVSFFFEPGRAIGFPHFHHRERAKLTAKPLARISAIINVQRRHIEKLMRSYEIEAVRPVPQIDLDESGLTPEKVAERLRAYWMLPRGPVANVVDVIEEAGGIVILSSFGTALLPGISFRSEGLPPLFFMNKDVAGDRFRVSLAQELGHIVMHTLPADDAKMDDEAGRFAAAFLMPALDIKPYLINPKISNFGRVKSYWKVPIKMLIERSYDLKLITDHQYKSLKAEYNKLFKQGEDSEIPVEKPSKLGDIIRYHRDNLGFTVEDMARMLALRIEDMETYYGRRSLRLVVSN